MIRTVQRIVGVCLVLGLGARELPAAEGQYEWKNGRWVRAVEPTKSSYPGQVTAIRQQIDEGKHGKAVELAEEFLKSYPSDAGREEVMMLAGQAEMGRGRYYDAYKWFKRQLENYPDGQYRQTALEREYQIGDAFLSGKKRRALKVFWVAAYDEGIEILRRLCEQAPGSEVAERGMLRIGEYYFAKGDYAEAAEAYDQFVELFGTSSQVPRAMLRAAMAIYHSFRGVAFEDTPLIEATQRLRRFQAAYPQLAAEGRVAQTLQHIDELRAEKVYRTGQFYERKDRREAAVHYYRLVVWQYPQLEWARQATAALRRLGALPAVQGAGGATSRPAGQADGEGSTKQKDRAKQ